jgi:hypothetical protein
MRTFNFSLLAVLGFIALIGATPNIAVDAMYVLWQQLVEILT